MTTSNGASQTIDLSQLENLIEAEKFEEAQKLLKDYFTQPLSPEERGEAYINVASAYLDIVNYFNKQRAELLETSLKALEGLDKQRRQLDDLIDLDKVRKQIKG